MRIGSFWWRLALRVCPYDWRDRWVPGWKELHTFLDAWMQAPADPIGRPAYVPEEDEPTTPNELQAPPELTTLEDPLVTRSQIAYMHLGGNGVSARRLRFVLQCIGSLTKALKLIHRGRELTPDERQRFSSHACPPDKVDWQHIASGTAGLLGALFMLPPAVEE